MRIIEYKNQGKDALAIRLSEADVRILQRVIPPPFPGLEKELGDNPIDSDKIRQVMDVIGRLKLTDEVAVEEGFLNTLTRLFKASADVLDPMEMSTITTVSWTEAMGLYERLFCAAHYAPRELEQITW
jgi:hypothetical protein